ncbi:hypothetical protein [uncultured Clostridium sp.]|uniref:type III-A CRISPR-associated RAMP protein Csm4 n=1 Tax=uncultured Clostridium sp. TaxID=59620 RepID=UPI0025E2244C|nr:hypothetical protein [uncultured Clostridium sp.]
MKKVILKFKENTKFHIGEELYDYIPSDKLYSMLVNALSFINDEKILTDLVNDINDKVQISSAFIGIRITKHNKFKEIDFLPKPYFLVNHESKTIEEEEKEIKKRKKYKKVAWISHYVFNHLSLGLDMKKNSIDYSFGKGIIFGGKYYIENSELEEDEYKAIENYYPVKNQFISRNLISRYSKESVDTYYEGFSVLCSRQISNIKIEPYMYFYVKDDANILNERSLKSLLFISLGGKRSVGAGVIEDIEIREINETNEFSKNNNSIKYVNLSMVYPKEKDLKYIEKYALEKRNGFIFSKHSINLKKPTIRMIKEGSIFSDVIDGDVYIYEDERLKHPIYIFGRGFLVPFGGSKNE